MQPGGGGFFLRAWNKESGRYAIGRGTTYQGARQALLADVREGTRRVVMRVRTLSTPDPELDRDAINAKILKIIKRWVSDSGFYERTAEGRKLSISVFLAELITSEVLALLPQDLKDAFDIQELHLTLEATLDRYTPDNDILVAKAASNEVGVESLIATRVLEVVWNAVGR
jgi:hypothetical protein